MTERKIELDMIEEIRKKWLNDDEMKLIRELLGFRKKYDDLEGPFYATV